MVGELVVYFVGDDLLWWGDGWVSGGEIIFWGVLLGFVGGGRGVDSGELVFDLLFCWESGMICFSMLLLVLLVGEWLCVCYDDYW